VFHVLFDEDDGVAFAVANAITRLMDQVKPSEWTRLYPSFQYLEVNQPVLARLGAFPAETAVHLLGIASLNGSGYIRQEAVERLGRLGLRETLPYLILRLADWVPQVRTSGGAGG
jgi:HEAT repeat protein